MLSDKLNNYLIEHSHPISRELKALALDTEEKFTSSLMLSGPLVSSLLRLLVRISKAKFILDLGTYTGFSALSIAEVMEPDAQLLTCEIDPIHIETAKNNFNLHPMGSRIKIFEGCVFDCLQSIEQKMDLVFLDANKKTYIEYYHLLVPKLKSGGLLIMDDTLWKGMAISPTREREKRMNQINQIVIQDSRVENLLLPVRNGVNIIYKI